MAYKKLCQWCLRYDCAEKGGEVKRCPVDRDEPVPIEVAVENAMKYHKSLGIRFNNMGVDEIV